MAYVRKAGTGDISRIAEILVFTKRMHYRDIFHEDNFSFNVLQVVSIANGYLQNPRLLDDVFVYDDGIVKGMIHISGAEVAELYVDTFFHGQGIGRVLMEFAIANFGANCLWVLEKNSGAIAFYEKMGFRLTDDRKIQPGTPEYIVKMKRI